MIITKDDITNMSAGFDMDMLVMSRFFKMDEGSARLVLSVPYSTNDILAFNVMMELFNRGLCAVSNGDGDSYDVTFMPFGTYYSHAFVSEDTFALAVCKVAILITL